MKIVNALIIFAILCLFNIRDAKALSCDIPLRFIIHCKAGNCDEGFFAFSRRVGVTNCKTTFNVSKHEKIYKFKDDLKLVVDEPGELNGFYQITPRISPRLKSKTDFLSFPFLFEENENVKFKSDEMDFRYEKLKYPETYTLQDVINDLAGQSTMGHYQGILRNIWLPLVIIILIVFDIKRFRKKYGIAISLGVLGASIFALNGLNNDYAGWLLGSAIGIFYLLCSVIVRCVFWTWTKFKRSF